jgi:UPF0176 protein
MYKILLFYKYTKIEDPGKFRDAQMALCRALNLKGRMIVASEGVNGTFEGTAEDIKKYGEHLKSDPLFADVHLKISDGDGSAFPKLSIKARNEIVATHLVDDDIDPTKLTGKYITAEELYDLIHSEKEFYIVDMRNDYETEVGYFENSIFPNLINFRYLPEVLPKLAHLKDKTIVTVCTGGVRCEKASGFLVKNGFNNVYQLYGGIVTYMEKYPNEDFIGKLYVFDNRVVMGFNTNDPKHKIVGKCTNCGQPSEHFINCKNDYCHRHFICCQNCLKGEKNIFCPMGCRDYSKEHPEAFQ